MCDELDMISCYSVLYFGVCYYVHLYELPLCGAIRSRHVSQQEASMWSNQKLPRGTNRKRHVAQREYNMWRDQNTTRGAKRTGQVARLE